MMVTNCKGERSFSKLKLIKNAHRSTISQSRLNSLTLISIESQLLEEISFSAVINDFASRKCRNISI